MIAGFVLVALARALTLPRGLWEIDEIHFAHGVERFEPLLHRPHPPGYPLLIGLGKAFALVFSDPFRSLVALSVLSSLVSYLALIATFRRIHGKDDDRTALAGTLLFLLSPVMLVQATLPMSDPPSLMFLALSLALAAAIGRGAGSGVAIAFGACASAAVGCRPVNAVALIALLAVALLQTPSPGRRAAALAAFTIVSLGWLLPLVAATGGVQRLLDYQLEQVRYVATHDATASRAGRSFDAVAARFLANPWGPRWLALPVLGLAVAGTIRLVHNRRTAALPLAAASAAHLTFCFAVMDPGDAARYALPSLPGIAFAAAVGCDALAERMRKPVLAPAVTALVLAISVGFALPFLAARAREPSPVVQAVRWAEHNLPHRTLILASDELRPHADFLMRSFAVVSVEDGLRRAARHPRLPAYLLAEGESGWPNALTFSWPPSESFRRLTRNHYRIVSLSPIAPHWRFEPHYGVYGWEPDLRHPEWRWLDREAAVGIRPRGECTGTVELALDDTAPLRSNTVRISVGGEPTKEVEVERGEIRAVDIAIPYVRSEPVELVFNSALSFERASDPHAGRTQAVQLRGVWVGSRSHRPPRDGGS